MQAAVPSAGVAAPTQAAVAGAGPAVQMVVPGMAAVVQAAVPEAGAVAQAVVPGAAAAAQAVVPGTAAAMQAMIPGTAAAMQAMIPGTAAAAAVIASDKVVTSPLVGIFYSAPSPEAENFVKVGDTVKKGQVLGIIEAMKLMNEIESDYDGVVEAILVNNEDVVEYGQPLFRIR